MIRRGQPPADLFERDTPHPHIRCHAPRPSYAKASPGFRPRDAEALAKAASGASSTPRLLGSSRAGSEYWTARSSRAKTAVGGGGPCPKFPFVINDHSTVHGVV